MDCCREDEDSGCWVWQQSLGRMGYANQLTWPRYLGGDGKQYNAHVIAWIVSRGPVPEGLETRSPVQRPSVRQGLRMDAIMLRDT